MNTKAIEYRLLSEYKTAKSDKEKQNLQEKIENFYEILSDKSVFIPWRKLTESEQRVDWQFLQDTHSTIEPNIEAKVTEYFNSKKTSLIRQYEQALKEGSTKKILDINAISSGVIASLIRNELNQAAEAGIKTASEEIGVSVKSKDKNLRSFLEYESKRAADLYLIESMRQANETAKQGILGGFETPIILGSILSTLIEDQKKAAHKISGRTVNGAINQGRRSVFQENQEIIVGYIRSEILDSKTCNLCLTLDKRIIGPNDPMAQMDYVHDHCGGKWTAILKGDQIEGSPMPKTIRAKFQTIQGVPITNKFEQLKKAHNVRGNVQAKKEITKRIHKSITPVATRVARTQSIIVDPVDSSKEFVKAVGIQNAEKSILAKAKIEDLPTLRTSNFILEKVNIDELKTAQPVKNDVSGLGRVERMTKTLKGGGELPIIFINEDNVIVDGNHRVEAFKKANIKNIPALRVVDFGNGEGKVKNIKDFIK